MYNYYYYFRSVKEIIKGQFKDDFDKLFKHLTTKNKVMLCFKRAKTLQSIQSYDVHLFPLYNVNMLGAQQNLTQLSHVASLDAKHNTE